MVFKTNARNGDLYCTVVLPFKLHSHSVYSELRGDVKQRPCLAVSGSAFADGSCCVLVFCVMLATITYSF